MKNIRKYMMAAACMTAAAALVACTEAVKRDTEEEIQEMTVPKKPGPITKVPATLTCNGGEEFTFSVSKVQWAETYEWTIAEQEKSKISIIDGQGTNVITVRVVNDDVVIPAQSVSVVAKNELGASKVREYFAAITVSVPIELPGYTIKKYGKRWWMTENCHEAGEDGNLGVAPDLTAFSVAGLEASHLQRLNDAKGRYYTWYEAMTGISGCTAEQCPYVQNYEGVDDVGNAFKLDGTEEGEFGVQIRGCCPEGWHVANANDWWDMLMAIKSEYAIPDDFAQGGYTFSGGHDGKPENAITKAGFYKSFSTEMSSLRENGRWHDQTFRPASSAMRLACSAFSRISATVPRPLMPISTYSTPAFAAAAISSGLMLLVELPTPRHWAVRLAAHTSAAAVNRILFFIASGYLV
jgi:uncharacterized protein (TIGR02145 family)